MRYNMDKRKRPIVRPEKGDIAVCYAGHLGLVCNLTYEYDKFQQKYRKCWKGVHISPEKDLVIGQNKMLITLILSIYIINLLLIRHLANNDTQLTDNNELIDIVMMWLLSPLSIFINIAYFLKQDKHKERTKKFFGINDDIQN